MALFSGLLKTEAKTKVGKLTKTNEMKNENKTITLVENVRESKLYRREMSEAQTTKERDGVREYYNGDVWADCDYLLKNGESFPVVKLGADIVSLKGWSEFSKGDRGAIQDFYNPDCSREELLACGFRELSTWKRDIEESSQQMEEARLAIKYRGGRGYHYSWWILR